MNSCNGWGISTALLCILLTCNTSEAGAANDAESAGNFRYPSGVVTDKTGNVYVADTANNTIRKITTAGVVTTLAGTAGVRGYADGTGAEAKFYQPSSITIDSTGNIYVTDNNTLRKITPTGAVTTLAGKKGVIGHADGIGAAASFDSPAGLATDSVGNIYVADAGNNTIRKITPTGVVSTLAGIAGVRGHANGTRAAASFYSPTGIATDSAGNIYVSCDNAIRKITPGGEVTTLAGMSGDRGDTDGTGTAARFNSPTGIATDSASNVYVADYGNSKIRKITPAGVVTTLATSYDFPTDVDADNAGNIYVANTGDGTIRKITPAGVVTILASTKYVTPVIRQVQTFPAEVDAYSRELEIISSNPNAGGGVEGLLRLGRDAAYALVMTPKDSEISVRESLSDEALQALSLKMKGFMSDADMEPEPDFFLALAKRSNDPANVEFFEAYKNTMPEKWPVYVEQITNYSGCTRYGTLSLVNTYALWDGYRNKYPTRYQNEVRNLIHDIEFELDGTCACNDLKSVTLELETFIRKFPHAKIAARLRERLAQIRHGKSDMREHCQPG
ncbi:MAG: NHL repeat-containing protein [Sideroxydans sp.]|nr:NHL repeat-containing protein [Sideroxydans sp.]